MLFIVRNHDIGPGCQGTNHLATSTATKGWIHPSYASSGRKRPACRISNPLSGKLTIDSNFNQLNIKLVHNKCDSVDENLLYLNCVNDMRLVTWVQHLLVVWGMTTICGTLAQLAETESNRLPRILSSHLLVCLKCVSDLISISSKYSNLSVKTL